MSTADQDAEQINLNRLVEQRWHSLASRAERRRVRRQPGNHPSQLVRPSEPAKRVQSRPLLVQVRLLVQIRRGHPVTIHLVSSISPFSHFLTAAQSDSILFPLRAVVFGDSDLQTPAPHPHTLPLASNHRRETVCKLTRCIYAPARVC